MKLKNKDIYNYNNNLTIAFNDNNKYFPVKVNFIIQKNKRLLSGLSSEIDLYRRNIGELYGTLSEEEGVYNISKEKLSAAQKELNELMEVEQEVNIIMIPLKDIENLEFTSNQMDAMLFMINEEQAE